MDDYLNDNDQWEALKRWLKENGLWIVGGVALGGGGLLAWNAWNEHVTHRAQDASAQFAQLQTAMEAGKQADVQALAGKLRQDYDHTPYADHAELVAARMHVEKGEFDKAAEQLRAVMKESDDKYLREVARLRLARVELAQNKPDAALATLGDAKADAFSAAANEIRGDILLAKGDRKGALDAYRSALLESAAASGRPGAESGTLQLKIDELTTVSGLQAQTDKPKTESAPQ